MSSHLPLPFSKFPFFHKKFRKVVTYIREKEKRGFSWMLFSKANPIFRFGQPPKFRLCYRTAPFCVYNVTRQFPNSAMCFHFMIAKKQKINQLSFSCRFFNSFMKVRHSTYRPLFCFKILGVWRFPSFSRSSIQL